MERLRAQFANDSQLYPVRSDGRGRGESPPSIISVSSTDSSVVADGPFVPANGLRPVVVSDSEDDIPNGPNPLKTQQLNRMHSTGTQALKPPMKTGVPVHIPTHTNTHANMQPPLPVYRTQSETLNAINYPVAYEPYVNAAETQKALQDLLTDQYNDEDHEDITEEDAIVEGFRKGITLLPHQVSGRKWMAEREVGKKHGGILADDMGLGKTIQTLTRIVEGPPSKEDRKAGYAKATLVVCPVAVVAQWVSEIKKMTESLTVVEHHGPSRTTDPEVLARANVVVTSYSIVSNEYAAFNPEFKDESKKKATKSKPANSDDDDSDVSEVFGRTLKKSKAKSKVKDALFKVKWWRVVLDEAHNIKNRNTKAAQACCALDTRNRWCLTGTPMQNGVEELFSLFKFLHLKPLSEWSTFNELVATPIKRNRPTQALKRLQAILRVAMLRRIKTTVINGKPLLDLPDRIVNNVHCEFDEDERAFYNSVEGRIRDSVDKLQARNDNRSVYTSILVLLLRLRQACNHPSLVSEDYKKDRDAVEPKGGNSQGDDDADELADMLGGLGLSQTKRCQFCQTELTSSNKGSGENCDDCEDVVKKSRRKSLVGGPNHDLPIDSAKTRKIMELLADIDKRSESEEKTIIFSQFTSMLDLIQPFLKAKGIRYVRYDGSMNKKQRDESLETIRTSTRHRVILISFKAGSTGLNLTCCNNVILVDLWWNPALEDQAFDRAHRLGQTKNVNIYKLSIPETVEERILELQEKKRALANAALAGDKLKNMKLGMDDLLALFRGGPDREEDEEDD